MVASQCTYNGATNHNPTRQRTNQLYLPQRYLGRTTRVNGRLDIDMSAAQNAAVVVLKRQEFPGQCPRQLCEDYGYQYAFASHRKLHPLAAS